MRFFLVAVSSGRALHFFTISRAVRRCGLYSLMIAGTYMHEMTIRQIQLPGA